MVVGQAFSTGDFRRTRVSHRPCFGTFQTHGGHPDKPRSFPSSLQERPRSLGLCLYAMLCNVCREESTVAAKSLAERLADQPSAGARGQLYYERRRLQGLSFCLYTFASFRRSHNRRTNHSLAQGSVR